MQPIFLDWGTSQLGLFFLQYDDTCNRPKMFFALIALRRERLQWRNLFWCYLGPYFVCEEVGGEWVVGYNMWRFSCHISAMFIGFISFFGGLILTDSCWILLLLHLRSLFLCSSQILARVWCKMLVLPLLMICVCLSFVGWLGSPRSILYSFRSLLRSWSVIDLDDTLEMILHLVTKETVCDLL